MPLKQQCHSIQHRARYTSWLQDYTTKLSIDIENLLVLIHDDVIKILLSPLLVIVAQQNSLSERSMWSAMFCFLLRVDWCLFINSQSQSTNIGLVDGVVPPPPLPLLWLLLIYPATFPHRLLMGGPYFVFTQRKVFVWIKEDGGMLQYNVFESLWVHDSHDVTAGRGRAATHCRFQPADCCFIRIHPWKKMDRG